MSDFAPHDVVWTRETSGRIWQFLGATPGTQSRYFSLQAGDALLSLLRKRGVLRRDERVLDFGCGPGHLLEKLARLGIDCEGVDFSAASVEQAAQRVAGLPHCRGVRLAERLPTPLPESSFDTVLLIETIEHLLDDDLSPTLGEIARLLAPGGWFVVTTPHNENLAASVTMCPECGCRFHPMQHVRAFTIASLRDCLASHGFDVAWSAAVHLPARGERFTWLRRLARWLRGNPPGPNLVAIARKRD